MRSDAHKNIIELELTADSSCFQFHMKNNIGELPQANDEFLQTKKSNTLLHGIGLQSIKQISNSLGGDMTYEYNDEHFAIWIYLNI
jgi:sensor histidine kinase regulating citrate/malate metabolism